MDMGHNSKMIQRCVAVLLLIGTVLLAEVRAEQRVLFSFDESGHSVRQVIDVLEHRSIHMRNDDKPEAKTDSPELAVAQLKPGQATLIWQDKDLHWLATTYLPDPRIAHSPGISDGVDASRIGLLTGAWIANGPDEAMRVVVLLPENLPLRLAPEQWPLWLIR